MTSLYEGVFGAPAEAEGRAPARANLLGEHTDYNDGFVLPTPLAYETAATIGRMKGAPDGIIEAHAAPFGETKRRSLGDPPQGDWMDYVVGCFRALGEAGYAVPAVSLAISSDVPMGAGISSSAALEVAVLRAARRLLDLPLDDVELARLGQKAENAYVGMQCGIMDQMAASLGQRGKALFLDTRTMATETVPLPESFRLAIIHCGKAHQLTAGDYNTRRRECEAACAALGIGSLRDLDTGDLERLERLEEPLGRRARHVVTENRRVLDGVAALKACDAGTFGRLMDESHRSQRDDYQVSIPEIDALADSAKRHGAIGARLTGGGFGGSIVALVPSGRYDGWRDAVLADRPDAREI
ncbi:galactokinase [Inquilinus sp. CAU 1745]|uniref:galactokinase n=1 Tax=Inquilinus sp. CAU 1745 TaxID=3140369 RepID=UPI00325A9CAE